MTLWVIMACLCPAVLFSICEEMEIQKNMNWYALIYATVSSIGAPKLKALNLQEITYLSQMQSTACT